MFLVLSLLLAAGQGAAVWGTAVFLQKVLRLNGRWHRLPLMLLAWIGWLIAALILYTVAGGEGGLMDGFGMFLILAALSIAGTLGWTVIWLSMAPSSGNPDTPDVFQ